MKKDSTGYKMDTAQLVDLLKTEIREEDSIRSSIRTTMNIYITMLVAIMGGLATLIAKPYETWDYRIGIVLLLGGIIVFVVAFVALKHYKSGFRRQVEAIVQEAKLESLLDMDNPEAYPLKRYWKGESLLPSSFIETREQFDNSQDFIKWMVSNTDVKIAQLLYGLFMIIGSAVAVFGVVCILL